MIAFTGYAEAGKDEFADALCEYHGYTKLGFADPLYRMAWILNPIVDWKFFFIPVYLQDIVAKVGWRDAKKHKGIRKYLQVLGTEAGRECIDDDVWVWSLFRRAEKIKGPVVVTNVRFKNEARAIMKAGGIIVRVHRPGYGPVNDHVSDSGACFSDASLIVINDGDKDEIPEKAAKMLKDLELRGE